MARGPTSTPPHGLWPSPIAAADVAKGTRRFGLVQGDGEWVYWTEGRPEEKGRQALLRRSAGGRVEELLPQPWSARSRVHEYGGGEFLVSRGIVYFVNDADQDVYELRPGATPQRLTRAPEYRFADFALDRTRARLVAVAERRREGAPSPDNLLVAIALEGKSRGAVTELVGGRDFFAAPCLPPDCGRLAYVAWDLPTMPWDEAELLVCELDPDGRAGSPRHIDGGDGVAASHPLFAPDGTLVYLSDRNGWSNLQAFDGEAARTMTALKIDLGRPMWSLGSRPFAIDAEGQMWAAPASSRGRSGVGLSVLSVDKRGRMREWHEVAETSLDCLSCHAGQLTAVTGSADAGPTVRSYRLGESYEDAVVRASGDLGLEPGDISTGELVGFRSEGGRRSYALYYPPAPGHRVVPRRQEKPPALVLAHGGPTSMASRALAPRIQFYTSRGFAVLDVDYAGSTGYGRRYRERLDGRWGIADVADCAAAARFLARRGLAHPDRIAIAGGSAGGYTTQMALATTTVFAAGSSHYGISDLSLLMEHTHKFESGYLHRLLGTTPKAWKKVCRERSPITLADAISTPLVLFQGLEDKVVPPEQSRLICERLRARGVAVELHEFEGEGHGFRRAETIVAVLEAELAFLVRAMGIG